MRLLRESAIHKMSLIAINSEQDIEELEPDQEPIELDQQSDDLRSESVNPVRECLLPPRNDSIASRTSTTSNRTTNSSEEDIEEVSTDCEQLTDEERAIKKRFTKLHFIAKELVSSEQVFVDVLKLLSRDFHEVAVHSGLPREVLDQLFAKLIPLTGFSEILLEQLRARLEVWPSTQIICDVIVTIGPFLKQYSEYMRDFEGLIQNLEDATKRFPSKLSLQLV